MILDCVCPIDGFMWTQTVSLGADPFPSPFDFNQLVTFPIPAHEDDGQPCSETNVSLYVAVHSDQNGIIACVSSNAIPSDWWENDS